MTRILLVETASPKRVRKKAEDILSGTIYPDPEIIILCGGDGRTVQYLSEIPGIEIVSLRPGNRAAVLRGLSLRKIDVLYAFWTGESKYRGMKLFALCIKSLRTHIDSGDGGVFPLTWKAIIRHWQFRLAHSLPSDHWVFVPDARDSAEQGEPHYYEGEKILVVQSAEPPYVLRALDRLREKPLFRDPRYTLFCRNRPEIVKQFEDHEMIHEVRVHSETHGSWEHLRELRKMRFDVVMVFFTGDPSYWKVKCFAFLLGARHKLVFNEHNGCFYFSLGQWLELLSCRLGERSRLGRRPRWTHQAAALLFVLIKVLLIPFRFVWLLFIWLLLRATARMESS